jgi:selenium metabolism protein YedF
VAGNIVFLNKDGVGHGDEKLGKMLIRAFLGNVLAVEPHPTHIVFMNSGVKLATGTSEVKDALRELEHKKVELLVCGTCVDYFGLKNSIAVGRISNQNEIVKVFTAASKVITI